MSERRLAVHGDFDHHWEVDILKQRPLILPRRRYVYPREAEEIERGALELLVHPADAEPFLATCALGFADPIAPTGVWTCPNPTQICAVAGGYAYLIDTAEPSSFEQIGYRPVLGIHPVRDPRLLLFLGNQAILAYGEHGCAWESPRLSDEGVSIKSIENGFLYFTGWHIATDCETANTLSLRNGALA